MSTTSYSDTLASEATRSSDRPRISFELYPPRTTKGEQELPATVAALAEVAPDFFSVTYGANGRTREASGALLQHILDHTSVLPIAHLTCVGASAAQIDELVTGLLRTGIRDILALRGDPPAGEPDWRPHPQGLRSASELVALLRRIEERECRGGSDRLSISVAAYPGGATDVHGRPITDPGAVEALLTKQDAGADYAITQVFFDAGHYQAFVDDARAAGVRIPIVPGIIPLTDPNRLLRLEALTGVPVPPALLAELESAADPDERYRRGLSASVDLVHRVLELGAPGLHIYTFNSSRAALDLLNAADLVAARPGELSR
ncbi:MAG: methylenetetrahydrofolate reductase [Beutenbergiaceae bacterium]